MSTASPPSPSPSPPPLPQPTTRKFPLPCWTQDETHVLIEAYRDRWYALRRRSLRALDWDAISAIVARRCPLTLPPKSSIQCRHKMEKLRKRYKTEKQRSVANPGRFFSSWVLFQLMESLENGSSFSGLGAHPDQGVDFGGGISMETFPAKKSVKIEKNSEHYFDSGRDSGTGFAVKTQFLHQNLIPQACELKGDRNLVPPGFRPNVNGATGRNFYPEFKSDHSYEVNGGGRSHAKVFSNRDFAHPGFRSRKHDNVDRIADNGVDFGESKGYSSLLRSGDAKKKCGVGNKRKVDAVAEMISSIKMMGEEFMKVEMMKMEMAREIEKMRMEMEMKRYKFMVESQQQIVDAFANALSEKKKKKTKVKVELPDG
ncbi:protein FIP2 [Ziziphus jujuba]|uniref:Protein FIP2 n=1 Tax=Ziziphus jujuba TaxID=326968 RepID=A0A6P4AKX7_ZIZJJ|nr:protein FIP2 [Ziziphus jujuba]